MSARRRTLIAVVGLVSLPALAGGLAWAWRARELPRRFDVVVEGRLFRSGTITPEQLGRVKARYGVRRVLCLLDANAPETAAERAEAKRLELDWVNIPLTGDGASTPEQRELILKTLADVEHTPTLVHCAAGVNRTGLVVGLYRLRYQGWPLDRVMKELKARGFEDKPHHENLRAALAEEARRREQSASEAGGR